jgi:hypothetical protein
MAGFGIVQVAPRAVVAPQDGHRSETRNREFRERGFLQLLTKLGVSKMCSLHERHIVKGTSHCRLCAARLLAARAVLAR